MEKEEKYKSYEVPKKDLPAGVAYRKFFGTGAPDDKPKKSVAILRIAPLVDP